MKTWWFDAGHGGIINGVYQTAGKRSPEWEHGVYCEGVGNRRIAYRVVENLVELGVDAKTAPYINETDTPLNTRVAIINKEYNKNRNLVVVSIHSNAGAYENQGSGFCAYTSVGQTESDKIATCYYNEMMKLFPGIYFYKDTKDGDIDMEQDFSMTKLTNCPAVLSENLFMNTKKDYLMLNDPEVINKIVLGHVNMVLSYEGKPTITELPC